MKHPILLLKKDLLVPINQAIERLEKIRTRKENNNDEIILEGLFVLSVATFENSLNDTLKYLFKKIPEKIDLDSANILKEELINGNPLLKVIEDKINLLSYKNFGDIIDYFLTKTEIKNQIIVDVYKEKIKEIKATRNLLIHNNLKINSFYIETAGDYIRSDNINSQLHIGQDYLYASIVLLSSLLIELKEKLENKYSKFTKIRALKELWGFIFNTPILNFEEIWDIDLKDDKISGYNKQNVPFLNISTSEEMFLEIWVSHVKGFNITLNRNFFHFDENNIEKLKYLLSVLKILKN